MADISNNDSRKTTEIAAGGSTEGEPRVDEHTMSNEVYRRLTLHNLIIRHADSTLPMVYRAPGCAPGLSVPAMEERISVSATMSSYSTFKTRPGSTRSQ